MLMFRFLLVGMLCTPLLAQVDSSCVVFEGPIPTSNAIASSAEPAWGERVTYRAFDGTDHLLTIFPARHVEFLLPDSWIGGAGLSPDQVRRLVSRGDLLYETYRELTLSEPWGFGRTKIAMVDLAGGQTAHARRSFKGMEFQPYTLDDFREALTTDSVPLVFSHEMAHNFDRSSSLFRLGSDPEHAWVALVQHLSLAYEKSGGLTSAERIELAIDQLIYPPQWLMEDRYTFESCTAPGATCGDHRLNSIFGYMGLRAIQLHGLSRASRLLSMLTDRSPWSRLPNDSREGADFYMEALAEAVEQDVSCYADIWKWHVSPDLRQRLGAKFGSNRFCADNDGDGWTPFDGDHDDSDASIHPGARDVPDGRDNDCDGIIDNSWFDEEDAGFGMEQTVALPVVLDGRIGGPGDNDSFRVSLGAAARVIAHASYRSAPFAGRVQLVRVMDGAVIEDVAMLFHGVTRLTWHLDSGTYRIVVSGANAGDYRLRITEATPWPVRWGHVAPAVETGSSYRLAATTESLAGLPETPVSVEFRVDGVGIIATLPWSSTVAYDWTPEQPMRPLHYRARLRSASGPLTDWSAVAEAESPAPSRSRPARR